MEDAHTHILSLAPEDPSASFFAVYDGHGGAKVAAYAGDHLHKTILSQEEYAAGNIEEAMRKGFLQIDQDMLSDSDMREELAGTTAIAIIVKDGKIFVGNVGDSRAVASFSGTPDPLSIDHKPSSESEAKRINAAGGWVEFNRVNGNLALSRALGDFVFKRNEKKSAKDQIVTAFPDVQSRDVSEDLEFIVIACDGIWDVLSNEEVVDFVRKRIASKMEPSIICEELMTRCLAPGCQMGGLGCDNMTVILICFINGKSYEELAAKCSLPVRAKTRSTTNDHPTDGTEVLGDEEDEVVVNEGSTAGGRAGGRAGGGGGGGGEEDETTGIADSPDSCSSSSSSSSSSGGSGSSSSNGSSSGHSSTGSSAETPDHGVGDTILPLTSSSPSPVPTANVPAFHESERDLDAGPLTQSVS